MTDLDQAIPTAAIIKERIADSLLKIHMSHSSNSVGSSNSCNEDSNLSSSDRASLASQEDRSRLIVHKNTARKKTFDSLYHLKISPQKVPKRLDNGHLKSNTARKHSSSIVPSVVKHTARKSTSVQSFQQIKKSNTARKQSSDIHATLSRALHQISEFDDADELDKKSCEEDELINTQKLLANQATRTIIPSSPLIFVNGHAHNGPKQTARKRTTLFQP